MNFYIKLISGNIDLNRMFLIYLAGMFIINILTSINFWYGILYIIRLSIVIILISGLWNSANKCKDCRLFTIISAKGLVIFNIIIMIGEMIK